MNKRAKISLGILIIGTLAVSVPLVFKNNKKQEVNYQLPSEFKLGLVNKCRTTPAFINSLNMRQPAIDSKQRGHQGGLLIRDLSTPKRTWMHPSWKKSGNLAGFDRDSQGNIYTAPLPYVSLIDNPPALQNQLYKIDHKTAQMSLLMKMPGKAIPNSQNPFGTMGLFYDCDTNSLYVSSVAGSTAREENGIIYQIDLTTNQVVSQLTQTDAIGVGVLNTLKGKRLYFGSARKPHVYSIHLDEKGHFIGDKKYEFSLSNIQGGDTTVAKKFIFSQKKGKFMMTVKETEFGFRLMAENNLNRKKYHFQYSLSKDDWAYLRSSRD